MNLDSRAILHVKLVPMILETLIFRGTSLFWSLRRTLYAKTCLGLNLREKYEDSHLEMLLAEMMDPNTASPRQRRLFRQILPQDDAIRQTRLSLNHSAACSISAPPPTSP